MDGNARFNTLKVALTESSSLAKFVVIDNNGKFYYSNSGGGGGGVTTVSVVTANGLAGIVANPTTTPTITLSTTVTGILKGNGTAISAATAGTDYISSTVGTASWSQNAVSSSYAATASLPLRGIINAAVNVSTITFTKGDNTTFDITVASDVAASAAKVVMNNTNTGIWYPSFAVSGSSTQSLYVNSSSFSYNAAANLLNVTASYALYASQSLSASFASTASYWSGSILNATSASFASTASYWSGSILNATSASFATTASYALNAGGVTGGNTNYVARWASATTLTTGSIYDNGTNVGISTTSPGYALTVSGTIALTSASVSAPFAIRTSCYHIIYNPSSNPAIYIGSTPDAENYYDNGAHNFRSAGGGTYYAVITSAGYMGIGTTGPGYKLDISGSGTSGAVRVTDATSPALYLNNVAVQWKNYIPASSNDYRINDGVADYVTVKYNSGNVGIGTITPNAKLDVVGSTKITQNAAAFQLSGSDHVYIEFYPTNSLGRQAYFGFPSPGSKQLYIVNEATNGDIILIPGSGGKVGIGTTSPSAKLEIKSSAANNLGGLLIRASGTSNYPVLLYENSSNGGVLDLQNSANTTTVTVSSNGNSFFNGGNVGIGTASPSQKLSVEGTISASGDLYLKNANTSIASDGASLYLKASGNVYLNTAGSAYITNTGYAYMSGSTINFKALTTTNQSNVVTIDTATGQLYYTASSAFDGGGGASLSGGKTKYNTIWNSTTTVSTGSVYQYSSTQLQLTGSSLAVGDIIPSTTPGRIDASNDIVAYSSSDKRFKTNITPITNALEKITQIGGYEFDWIENPEHHGFKGHDVGVIAQEIEAVLPEVVSTRDSGYKAVKYEKIVPLLIEAIKEQQKQINNLQQQINKLINGH
jgi:hypothetical protein